MLRIRRLTEEGVAVARKVEVDQLVGASEISRRLGLRNSSHVHQIRQADPTFPPPLVQLSEGRSGAFVWYWPDVEWWAKRQGRLPLIDDTSEQPDRSTGENQDREAM